MSLMAIAKFERLFRLAAGLDVDKSDLKRYSEFVNDKLYDLLLRAEAAAKANGRDVIEPHDLPITKGLQERIHEFSRIDEEIELRPILDHIAARPPLDRAIGEETESRLPAIAGGITVALAKTFKAIDAGLKNPQTEHWERSLQVFDLLL
jgi:histone H3/H4